MAIAATKTMLPIDTFFKIIGFNPLHGNGVEFDAAGVLGVCAHPLVQFNWQNANSSGREEIAQIIAEVEERISNYLNFYMVPTFTVGERHEFPQTRDVMNWWPRIAGGLRVDKGFVISGGIEAKTLVSAGVAIVYSDSDSDGYAESARIDIATSVTSAGEIVIFYPGMSGDDQFEIRPTSVSIAGGIATIRCRREQLVVADRLFGLDFRAVDGADNTAFLTHVDVYRRYLDPSSMIEFRWQAPCAPGAYSVQSGVVLVNDARIGSLYTYPATYDAGSGMWTNAFYSLCGMPEWALVSYKSGWALDRTGQIDDRWARVISYLTLAMLDRPLCGCNAIKEFTDYWSEDLAQSEIGKSYQVSRRKLDNPIGTTRAAVYVWDVIQRYRIADRAA